MRSVILHGSQMKKDPHTALAIAFGFPDYYGKNLDALHDCLTDITEETEVILIQWEQMGDLGRRIQQVLTDSSAENPRLTVYATYPLRSYTAAL